MCLHGDFLVALSFLYLMATSVFSDEIAIRLLRTILILLLFFTSFFLIYLLWFFIYLLNFELLFINRIFCLVIFVLRLVIGSCISAYMDV